MERRGVGFSDCRCLVARECVRSLGCWWARAPLFVLLACLLACCGRCEDPLGYDMMYGSVLCECDGIAVAARDEVVCSIIATLFAVDEAYNITVEGSCLKFPSSPSWIHSKVCSTFSAEPLSIIICSLLERFLRPAQFIGRV